MDFALTAQQANVVYDLLVDMCKARPAEQDRFVKYFCQPLDQHEWRFEGVFGLGGKFKVQDRGSHWFVAYYPEDRTDKLDTLRDRVNGVLAYIARGAELEHIREDAAQAMRLLHLEVKE